MLLGVAFFFPKEKPVIINLVFRIVMGHVDIVRLMWTLNVISQITLICFRGITDMEFDLAV